MSRRTLTTTTVAALALALAACGSDSGDGSGGEDGTTTLHVAAAASLTEAFEEIATDFEAEHAGVEVEYQFAGSSDLATQIETYLARVMRRREIDERFAPIYAQMFVGMVALTGDWWLEHGHEFTAEEIAAHMVNLGWNGLTGLEASPRLETTAIDATAPPRGNSSLVTRLDDAADGVPPADA